MQLQLNVCSDNWVIMPASDVRTRAPIVVWMNVAYFKTHRDIACMYSLSDINTMTSYMRARRPLTTTTLATILNHRLYYFVGRVFEAEGVAECGKWCDEVAAFARQRGIDILSQEPLQCLYDQIGF